MLSFDESALTRLVKQTFGEAPAAITRMPGGASSRQYLRMRVGEGAAERRMVAMFVPDSAPEEVTSGPAATRWPFLEVHELLTERGVRVPRILAESTEEGLLLLEDLGDDTLGAVIEREPEAREDLYRRAVVDLANAQRRLDPLPDGSVVRTRAFDEKLLRWELEHFREWGLEARGIELSASDRGELDAIFDRLAARIASWPRSFVHRDYQSRNLMVRAEGGERQLVWIDFQDALLGPRIYDLVALLQDSYVAIDQPFIDARLDDFARARSMSAADREQLGLEFDVVSVQRKLKDAGRFVFIDKVKKNPSFLPYVEPTLAKVRRALARLEHEPEMQTLSRIIARAWAGE